MGRKNIFMLFKRQSNIGDEGLQLLIRTLIVAYRFLAGRDFHLAIPD